jgi:hypothetical protein
MLFDFVYKILLFMSQESSVGIAMGYWLNGQGSIPDMGKRFSSTP